MHILYSSEYDEELNDAWNEVKTMVNGQGIEQEFDADFQADDNLAK